MTTSRWWNEAEITGRKETDGENASLGTKATITFPTRKHALQSLIFWSRGQNWEIQMETVHRFSDVIFKITFLSSSLEMLSDWLPSHRRIYPVLCSHICFWPKSYTQYNFLKHRLCRYKALCSALNMLSSRFLWFRRSTGGKINDATWQIQSRYFTNMSPEICP